MKFHKILPVALAVAMGGSAPALAQGRNVDMNRDGSVYARINAGVLVINDLDFSIALTQPGFTANGSGSFTFDAGPAFSGAIGYRFNKYFAAEAEFGYATAGFDSVQVNGTITSGGTVIAGAGSADIDGDVTVLSGMVNLLATPFSDGKFRPHFGVGLGAANVDMSIDRIDTVEVNSSDDETNFVAAGIIGFDYSVSKSVSLGARYRYLWVNSGDEGLDDATAHMIAATATISF